MNDTDRIDSAESVEANVDEGSLNVHDDETNQPPRRREIGGRNGPDPVRYGDWEKNGRCIDF